MSPETAVHVNPFPGLRPFHEDEEHLFFGRESQIDAMVNKLAATRFLAVVGSSGSGKSSLVNCGLRPNLHRGLMRSAGTLWHIAQFRPGSHPIKALAGAMAQALFADQEHEGSRFSVDRIIETDLRTSKLGLIETYRQASLAPDTNLLVVVDQFEELFRYSRLRGTEGQDATDEARAFVNLLLEVREQTAHPIYVAITMRSDFLEDCAQFAGLPEAINEGQYLVPRMSRDERRAAIAGPVAVGGARISSPLLTRLVNDVGDNPDQLSILQHALNRTWARWQEDDEDALDLPHYEAVGTMARALDQHAERTYADLKTDRERFICEKLFKALTDKGLDPRGVRRPTRLGDLCVIAGASEDEVEAVMEVFRKPSRSFLMPPAGTPLDPHTVIDISHESLMRVWERLKLWVNDEAESAQTYRRLAVRAVLYEQKKESLLGDPQLQRVLEWREETRPNEAWAQRYHTAFALAMRFLDKSERRKKVWMLLKAGAVVVAVGLIFGLIFVLSQQRVIQQRNDALAAATAARDSLDKALVDVTRQSNRAQDALAEVTTVNASLAEAVDEAEAQRQLARAAQLVAQENERIAEGERDAANMARSQVDALNAQLAMALDSTKQQRDLAERLQGEATRARQVTVGLALASRAISQMESGDPELGALLARQAYLFNQRNDGSFQNEIYDALRQTLNALEPGAAGPNEINVAHRDEVRAVAYSPDGRSMASAGNDGVVYLSSAENLSAAPRPLRGHDGQVRSVTFSPDGATLASAGDDGTVRVWDVASGTQRYEHSGGYEGGVRAVAFSPGGSMLAVAGADGTVRVLNATGSNARRMTGAHAGPAQTVAFSQDGTVLASGGDDGTVRLWNAGTATELNALRGHQGAVQAVAFGPEGRLVSAGTDATVRVWDPATGVQQNVLRGHGGPVNAVAFSATKSALLASASGDQSVRLWNLDRPDDSPVILQEGGSWVRSIAFSPDGAMLVAGSRDRKVRRWHIDAALLAGTICQNASRPLTDEEWRRYVGTDIGYETYRACATGSQ